MTIQCTCVYVQIGIMFAYRGIHNYILVRKTNITLRSKLNVRNHNNVLYTHVLTHIDVRMAVWQEAFSLYLVL